MVPYNLFLHAASVRGKFAADRAGLAASNLDTAISVALGGLLVINEGGVALRMNMAANLDLGPVAKLNAELAVLRQRYNDDFPAISDIRSRLSFIDQQIERTGGGVGLGLAAEGKGFTVGALMAANPAYVLFDPQCPHCGHLWTASQALLPKAKFVWIPVSFINGKSAPQGAAILTAANPAEFMAAHEASLLAGSGGTPLPASVPPEVEAIIKANTVLFNDLAAESVPYMVAKNVKTGQVVANAGAMQTAALAEFLGVN